MQNVPLTSLTMPRAKATTTRQKSTATYSLTLAYADGSEVLSTTGPLLAVLQYMNERAYCFKHGEVDNYARIRREIVASGGAYSRFFASVDGMPVQLLIIAEALLPAPAPAPARPEPVAPSGPLLPSVQRVIDSTNAVLARRESSPDFAPVVCTSCKESFLQNKLFGNRLCAACLSGERSSAPRPSELAVSDSAPVQNKCGNFHPTLSCERLSKWQAKQYGCTCPARRANK